VNEALLSPGDYESMTRCCPTCGAQINARRDGIHEIDAVQVCSDCWVEATLAHIDATAARILGQAGK
jgi:NMD protein affecting ribosome stability and mRNA decay